MTTAPLPVALAEVLGEASRLADRPTPIEDALRLASRLLRDDPVTMGKVGYFTFGSVRTLSKFDPEELVGFEKFMADVKAMLYPAPQAPQAPSLGLGHWLGLATTVKAP